jgi:hypothetical protein
MPVLDHPASRLRRPLSLFVSAWIPVGIFVLLLGVALLFGLRTTHGLEWPSVNWEGVGIDLYRDISSAQTMINTGYGPDPTYFGERTWYNPLTPTMIAVTSVATGWPVHLIATHIGTYANLLAPLCFFLMCAMLFDRWTALFATTGFLFLLPGSLPSWISATYSPWFLPVNFVQAVFYLAVIALSRAIRDGRLAAYAVAGLVWGLVFLGHTAPALVLGGMTLMWAGVTAWSGRRPGGRAVNEVALRFGLMVILAIVVSLPLIAIIVGHYGLHMKNPEPSAYSEPLLSRELPTLIRLHLTIPMAIAAVGLVVLVRRKSHHAARLLVLSWMASAGVFLTYSFVRLGAKLAGIVLPTIVPSFHFFFYLKAAIAVLFGVGLTAIGRMAVAWIAKRRGVPASPRVAVAAGRAAAACVCLALLVVQAKTYAARPDFDEARRESLAVTGSDQVRAFAWIREHLGPTDVVLTGDRDAATIVAPSGAKVVCIFTGFSNPYVDFEARRDARDRMFAALERGDRATFHELAARYHVTYVLTRARRSTDFDSHPPADLQLAFTVGDVRIYRVLSAQLPQG